MSRLPMQQPSHLLEAAQHASISVPPSLRLLSMLGQKRTDVNLCDLALIAATQTQGSGLAASFLSFQRRHEHISTPQPATPLPQRLHPIGDILGLGAIYKRPTFEHNSIKMPTIMAKESSVVGQPAQLAAEELRSSQPHLLVDEEVEEDGESMSRVDTTTSKSKEANGRVIFNDRRWHARFEELKAYKKMYGDCSVPREYKDNPKLGRWVNTQRMFRSKGLLSDDRIEKLDNAGFMWKVDGRHGHQWFTSYEKLVKFKKLYGHCRVPRKYDDDPKLGSWCQTQRTQMKYRRMGRESHLTEDRINLLDEIRFEWNVNQKSTSKKGISDC